MHSDMRYERSRFKISPKIPNQLTHISKKLETDKHKTVPRYGIGVFLKDNGRGCWLDRSEINQDT